MFRSAVAHGLVFVPLLLASDVPARHHCRPTSSDSGIGALAPSATGLISGIGNQGTQLTVIRTITVIRSAAQQTPGAMVTVYFSKGLDGKYPSVGAVHQAASSSMSGGTTGSDGTSGESGSSRTGGTSDAGTTGTISILPYPMLGDEPHSPGPTSGRSSNSGSSSGSATSASSMALPTGSSSHSSGVTKSSGASTGMRAVLDDISGTSIAGKATDRLPGGQGGVVLTSPTSGAGAWGANPTLSTSTGGTLTYNRH